MYAYKGDHLLVTADTGAPREAEVLSGDYADGHPPFWVRWADTGEESLWTPQLGVEIEHAGPSYPAEYDLER